MGLSERSAVELKSQVSKLTAYRDIPKGKSGCFGYLTHSEQNRTANEFSVSGS